MKQYEQHKCHNGIVLYLEHESESTCCTMRLSVFLPPNYKNSLCPTLIFLAGLTCNHETFATKAQAYQLAAQYGLIIVTPDTSPRGEEVADSESYDLGKGAGFYLNATEFPWKKHYQMESYIVKELVKLLVTNYPVDKDKLGIFGHSMGGHGALTIYLKYPDIFKSISAFAPICSPIKSQWGKKAFSSYLGSDESTWHSYDATELMLKSSMKWYHNIPRAPILIDQGFRDQFIQDCLYPKLFEEACKKVGHPINLRYQDDYDHGYFFVQSFMADHLFHHVKCLGLC